TRVPARPSGDPALDRHAAPARVANRHEGAAAAVAAARCRARRRGRRRRGGGGRRRTRRHARGGTRAVAHAWTYPSGSPAFGMRSRAGPLPGSGHPPSGARASHEVANRGAHLVGIGACRCNGGMTRRSLPALLGLVLILATSTAWLPGSAAPAGDRDNVAGEEDEGPGSGPAGSDQWFAAQRLYPFRSPVALEAGYRAAQDQAVRAATAPRAAGLAAAAWQPLGPANIGGRVTDLVVDPVRPDTVSAGAATGGVW